MKRNFLRKAKVSVIVCMMFLSGSFVVIPQTNAENQQKALERITLFGFTAVPGDIYLEIHRDDNVSGQYLKGDAIVLAQYTVTNTGYMNVELNQPSFYAVADRFFVLKDNVQNVRISVNTQSSSVSGSIMGNRLRFPNTITIPAYTSAKIYLMGDIDKSAKVGFLDFEPDFTYSKFVINYADSMGNDLNLAPFNLTGNLQTIQLDNPGTITDSNTSDIADYARYFFGVEGTLTSPYIPEGAIIRDEAGIDVYVVKYANNKRFKRLILSPSVFKSYKHLKWENVLVVNDAAIKSYATSSYVHVTGDNTVWRLDPMGDTGTRRRFMTQDSSFWIDYDTDGVYEINATDRDSYVQGSDIVTTNLNSVGLAMISPNGGENLVMDHSYNILWKTAANNDRVDLILYKGNNCSTGIKSDIQVCGNVYDVNSAPPTAIATDIPNTGSYAWIVPITLPTGSDYRIAVQSTNNLSYIAQSQGAFTISRNY